jgi:hypothetical protein
MDDETKKKISDTLKGSKKENTDGYKKYIYILYNGVKEIYSSNDQRDISKYLKDNNLPSLFKLKKSDLLNFKFRKFIKTNNY